MHIDIVYVIRQGHNTNRYFLFDSAWVNGVLRNVFCDKVVAKTIRPSNLPCYTIE